MSRVLRSIVANRHRVQSQTAGPLSHSIKRCVNVSVISALSACVRSPDCPARSQSLYRLSYPGPPTQNILTLNVLVLGYREHCLWRHVRTLESEWTMVTEMLFTVISKELISLLRFSRNAIRFPNATVEIFSVKLLSYRT
jgi:hypothetical protein